MNEQKSNIIRYSLLKTDTDKTYTDYIKTTIKFFKSKGLNLQSRKLPRKLKKKLKKLKAWEFLITY